MLYPFFKTCWKMWLRICSQVCFSLLHSVFICFDFAFDIVVVCVYYVNMLMYIGLVFFIK